MEEMRNCFRSCYNFIIFYGKTKKNLFLDNFLCEIQNFNLNSYEILQRYLKTNVSWVSLTDTRRMQYSGNIKINRNNENFMLEIILCVIFTAVEK